MPTTTKMRRRVSDRKIEEYLRAPYARILLPEKNGTYSAEILEFPGCLAEGRTPQEAIANLEQAAKSWIAAALDQGQEIPPPTESRGFSGRLALRLPKGLHRQATRYAERNGTSLNQFLVAAVAAFIGSEDVVEKIAQRYSWLIQQQNLVFTNVSYTVMTPSLAGSPVVFPQQSVMSLPVFAPISAGTGATVRD